MDPVSAGASVLTFITLAFSVTKTIHEVLSSIKDGPQVIRYLSEEVAQLQSILGRLSQISSDFTHASDVAELEGLARKCTDDVTTFQSNLRRLDISKADGRSERLWWRLKRVFTEKDLEQMRQVVRGHVQLLTTRLALMQTQQLSLSAAKSTEIMNLLQQLQHDVAALQRDNSSGENDQEDAIASMSRVMEVDTVEAVPCPDSGLTESIARLMKLVGKKACVVESDDAEQLIVDLEHLLQSIRRDAATKAPIHTSSNSYEADCSENEDVSKELRLTASLMLSAPSMHINQTGPLRFLANIPKGTIIHQERKRKTIETADGIITLTTNKRRRKCPGPDDGNNRREFVSKLVFKPRNTNTMLTLSVNQGQVLFDSFTSMLPRITVSNILPIDSLVFKLAAGDDIKDLIGLVSEGKASLHDRDTRGWSLLHYAVSHSHISMCSFLIQQGLEVNEVLHDCIDDPPGYSKTTALHLALDRPDVTRALLTTGADPTIDFHGWKALIKVIIDRFDVVDGDILRQVFDSPFVRYSDPRINGAFVWAFDVNENCDEKFDPQLQIKKLEYLLDRGCTALDRDYAGYTCLLHFFQRCYDFLPNAKAWKEVLVYVVQQGADVHATDAEGNPVSFFAYRPGSCSFCSRFYSSFAGDLWDAVLESCGYDVSEFRKFHPRRPSYTKGYTRKTFEMLWQGREHRCPYWNDEIWPKDDSWIGINSNDEEFQSCYACLHADNKRDFIAPNGCCCPGMKRPCREEVMRDEKSGRSSVTENATTEGAYNDEEAFTDDEICVYEKTTDSKSADEEARLIYALSGCQSQESEAGIAETRQRLDWIDGHSLRQHQYEPSLGLPEYSTGDSHSQGELFGNPWQED